ncbi:MAG TPA: hypothetical protein DEB23_05510 [Chitinophagaceae bacterium]|nr:hypothetical protein [Chitinophagaceae bacterium]
MVKNEILAQYWTSKEVNDAFDKMHPEELRYDLKAEVFLVLCEMNEDKLVGLFERNELKFYIVRIMLNMIKSDRSTFYKNYRNYSEFVDQDFVSDDNDKTDMFEKLELNMDGLHWYNKEMLKLYAIDFKKNAKELSRKTGIPYMSIIRTINKTKKQMKINIRK